MHEPSNDLWTGGPWEQPSPSFPTPPAVVIPPTRAPLLRPKRRWKRRRRPLFPFLTLFVLVVSLTVGTVAVRYLWPQESETDSGIIATSSTQDPFAALERAETGTGVTVTISPAPEETLTATEIYQKCVPSIVSLWAEGDGTSSTGTGIVMSADGYLLTNAHVVANSLRVYAAFHDDTILEAKLVGADADADVAVLKVDAHGLTPAEFGDSDQLLCGDMVVAIGDPLGYRTSITQGIVSGLDRVVTVGKVGGDQIPCIQTDAAINTGNSGGALVNKYGQVVGIVSIKMGDSYENIGFAIPMDLVKSVAEELISHGNVLLGRVRIGITYTSITQDMSALYGIPAGLRIVEVDPESDCAGKILPGDIVTAMDGTEVTDSDSIDPILQTKIPGDPLILTIYRADENGEGYQTVAVSLMEK